MDNEPTAKTIVGEALSRIEGVKHLDVKSTSIVTVVVDGYPAKVAVIKGIRLLRQQWNDHDTLFTIITIPEK